MRERNARADFESSTTRARLEDINSSPSNLLRIYGKCSVNPNAVATFFLHVPEFFTQEES
jgi:hypothetical protein